MNNLSDNSIMFDILPSSLSNDETISALSVAIGTELKAITQSINDILFYPNIENLSEELVDLLAEQFQVKFYDIFGLDLDKKRLLVKNSIMYNKRKGTKGVLQDMLKTLYDGVVEVEEWFDYGGSPFYFKIKIRMSKSIKEQDYKNLISIINSLKNVRSHLEGITKEFNLHHNLYTAHIIKSSKDIKIKRQNLVPIIKSTFYQGIFISKVRYRKIGFTVSDFEPKNIPIKINFERN